MLINQKFILHYVSAIQTTERGNVQNIQLLEPAPKDNFGDTIGTDNIFDVRIYNKDLIKLPDMMKIRLGSIVNCMLIISSKETKTKEGKTFYQSYIILKRIEVLKKSENDNV
jgi:hypothetical protein